MDLPPTWEDGCLNYVGWHNVLHDNFAGFPAFSSGIPHYLVDEKPYTYWQPAESDATRSVTVQLNAAKAVDYVALYNTRLDGNTLTIQTSPDLVTGFSTRATITPTTPAEEAKPILIRFTGASARRVKFTFAGGSHAPRLASVFMGQIMGIPMQEVGWAPPRMARKLEATTNVSNSGVFLGRSILRAAAQFTIAAKFLRLDWAYDLWAQFQRHAENRPFFFQWAIEEGGDTAFCWVEDDIDPPVFVTNRYVDAKIDVRGVME